MAMMMWEGSMVWMAVKGGRLRRELGGDEGERGHGGCYGWETVWCHSEDVVCVGGVV